MTSSLMFYDEYPRETDSLEDLGSLGDSLGDGGGGGRQLGDLVAQRVDVLLKREGNTTHVKLLTDLNDVVELIIESCCEHIGIERDGVPTFSHFVPQTSKTKPTLSVMFLSSVSSRTACSFWLISRDSSRVIVESVGREVYNDDMMPPDVDIFLWNDRSG